MSDFFCDSDEEFPVIIDRPTVGRFKERFIDTDVVEVSTGSFAEPGSHFGNHNKYHDDALEPDDDLMFDHSGNDFDHSDLRIWSAAKRKYWQGRLAVKKRNLSRMKSRLRRLKEDLKGRNLSVDEKENIQSKIDHQREIIRKQEFQIEALENTINRKKAENLREDTLVRRGKTTALGETNVGREKRSGFAEPYGKFDSITTKTKGTLPKTEELHNTKLYKNFHKTSLQNDDEDILSEKKAAMKYFQDMTGLDFSKAKVDEEGTTMTLSDATVKPYVINPKLSNEVTSISGDTSINPGDRIHDGGFRFTVTNPKGINISSGKLAGTRMDKGSTLYHGIIHVKSNGDTEVGDLIHYRSNGIAHPESMNTVTVPLEWYGKSLGNTEKLGTGNVTIHQTPTLDGEMKYNINTSFHADD